MDWLIGKILKQLESENYVEKDELEIYAFGLECTLLKLVHMVSYILIGLCMDSFLSLVVSGSVLISIRRKAGGYHAKTRLGCYMFSCGIVFLLCLVNRLSVSYHLSICEIVVTDILILFLAPVENENRKLEPNEKVLFQRQVRCRLVIINGMIAVLGLAGLNSVFAYCLGNGVVFAGVLLVLGVKAKKRKGLN